MIKHNTYFDGNVQSLGLETEKGYATVGVMQAGTYEFGATAKETITIISGVFGTKLPGKHWVKTEAGETINIPEDTIFDVLCESDVAYICYYG
jgi:purine/pyrimidine-nucleoside phosphorylase